MRCLVVNIMPHGPAYHFALNERPDVYWEKSDGTWLGFWTREWPDLLGEAVLKFTDRYDWEVWQTDYRADHIYSKTLESGVTHRLFPATERIYRPGVRRQAGIYSEMMLSRLKELEGSSFILALHGFRVPLYNEILRQFGPKKRFPIILIGHGMSRAPITEVRGLHRPITYVCLLVEQRKLTRLLQYADVMSVQSEYVRSEIQKVYRGRIEKLTMGCDFDFWKPVPDRATRNTLRAVLGIPPSATVFFASGNFVPLKQFDRLIEVFNRLSDRDDFVLIIAGHGEQAATKQLEALSKPLVEQDKAVLHPYVTG